MAPVSREELVEALARSSHEVNERHYRASGRPEENMTTYVHEHDYDRARAAVQLLEDLGVGTDPATA